MVEINSRKAAIVGCGFVGSASAFALMESGLFSEIVLIDANREKAEGEALDISHGLPFAKPMQLYAGDYADISDAAIIVVTAGAGQKPGETRLDLVKKNVGIFKSIIPDMPFEEKEELHKVAKNYGIEVVSLIAPTSEDRIKMIASDAEGFIYTVSSLGVTGMRSEIKTDLSSIVGAIKEVSSVPVAIGFGINTPEQAKKYSKIADGIIIGSAIVKIVAEHGKAAPQHVYNYVKSIKDAMA